MSFQDVASKIAFRVALHWLFAGVRLDEKIEEYLKQLDGLANQPGVCIHFSDVEERLGINPKGRNWSAGGYFAPAGLYGYLLTPARIRVLRSRKYSYAEGEDRGFVHVFRAKHMERMLNTSTYDWEQYRNDFKKLLPMLSKEKAANAQFSYGYSHSVPDDGRKPFDILSEMMRSVTRSSIELTRFLRKLGYSGVIDTDRMMAKDSPPQLVTFVSVDHLFTMPNPLVMELQPSF